MAPRRKKRIPPNIPLYRDFYIYVSGAYEKAYINALHLLLREQIHVNLHCTEYRGGGDFRSGIDELKRDLKFKRTQSVTKNLEKSEKILIQGDMDVAYATTHIKNFETELKRVDSRCKLIPSIKSFESWLKAHFSPISNQHEQISKSDIDLYIKNYSSNVATAKQFFVKKLSWEMIQKAMHEQHGNASFREFMQILMAENH